MESSNSTWTCRLHKAETIRVFIVLCWLKCAIFNIVVNQSQCTLFEVKLMNQTSNQMKKNLIPFPFWRGIANEVMPLRKRSKNLLPTGCYAKIHYKYV